MTQLPGSLNEMINCAFMKCPVCARDLPDESRFCLFCGAALEGSQARTLIHAYNGSAVDQQVGGQAQRIVGGSETSSSDEHGHAGFAPGLLLANRYRIVGLLGRGGMGEVYRADDLRLSHPVALKFLPERLSSDGAALARFHREVRIARQVSHPNVCPVFDIVELEGLHFLSMEYIDGEDLGSLLRRIGRLPHDKALEIARQLCAGLAAAHDIGILHRDFKPANVMIDGRGRARITDFGLSVLADQLEEAEALAGTPAYMSPEQLAGKEMTVQSDIYALGLVLYEVFTGKRPFEGSSLEELLGQRERNTPTIPPSLSKEIDPLVERVLLRCLENEPAKRPRTALEVAAALPGGDPLQAALAAGETPSPEMVAAAHKTGALPTLIAAACLASFLIGLGIVVLLSKRVELHNLSPLESPPDVLVDRATTIIKKLGYTDPPLDRAYGFGPNGNYLRYVIETDHSPERWEKLSSGRPWPVTFWYRESLSPLRPGLFWSVSQNDPPFAESGMTTLLLDTRGRLVDFYHFPAALDDQSDNVAAVDWSKFFAMAELDMSEFKPVDPKWAPVVAYDQRAAWEGAFAERPEIPLRVEAATYRGRLVYFEATGPWSRFARMGAPIASIRDKVVYALILVVTLGSLGGGVLLARRSLRLGRADRRGAFRLAIYVFAVSLLGWILGANHIPDSLTTASPVNFTPVAWATPVVWALYSAGVLWLFYVALEPYLRQQWPHRIISWNRLLAGGWRDPLVGRDVLIGGLFGVALTLISDLGHLVPKWIGVGPGSPPTTNFDTMIWAHSLFGQLFRVQSDDLTAALGTTVLVLLVYLGVRREWLAVAAVWLFLLCIFSLGGGADTLQQWLFQGFGLALFMTVLMRFGLLAGIASQFYASLARSYPLTSDFSAWYAGSGQFALLIMIVLAFYGFRTCLVNTRR